MQSDQPGVDICLSTYQGADFLSQQLDSIQNQTYQNWRVLIRDDGSSDGTRLLLADYAAADPQRFVLLEDSLGNLGPARSFSQILSHAEAPYVFLCDQDDIWQPEKLTRCLQILQENECQHGTDHPIALHTDLRMIDAAGNVISPSSYQSRRLDLAQSHHWSCLLVSNPCIGCSMACNRALLNRALPIPPDAVMHDWWLALTARGFGELLYLPEALIDYRQHDNNVVGASLSRLEYIREKVMSGTRSLRSRIRASQAQAAAFAALFKSQIAPEYWQPAEAWGGMPAHGFLKRKLLLHRYGFFRQGTLANFTHWLLA